MALDRPFKGSFDAAELFPGRRVAQPWASLERTFGAIGWSFALPCSPYILTATFRLPTSDFPPPTSHFLLLLMQNTHGH
jgi:hypothetical protein